MGRKKIKIEPIQEGRNRQVTYLKRKAGLFKKAHELATLTDSQVAVIVFGHNGRLSQFCSGDIDQVLLRYTEVGRRSMSRHTDWADRVIATITVRGQHREQRTARFRRR